MKDILRDSTVGQALNWASKGRILPYRDQRRDYIVPPRYILKPNPPAGPAGTPSSQRTLVNADTVSAKANDRSATPASLDDNTVLATEDNGTPSKRLTDVDLEKASDLPLSKVPSGFLVEWDGDDDPDNPLNWSSRKRLFVAFLVAFYTCSIYIGSAIYTSSIPSIMKSFGTSQVVATLGLSLFVLGYGIGPMFFSPIQDMPRFGRNPVYIAGLFLFVLFQMPILLAKNIETILIFRFLSGFVGSPALAQGGATMGDLYNKRQTFGIAIAAWSMGAVCGPVFGPVVGGFAAQANGWRWPIYELLWMSGFALILLGLFLPETLGETILIRRAERLRKLTGNPLLRTQAEIDAAPGETAVHLAKTNFLNAMKLNMEPAVAFSNLYIGLVYSLFYLWFESFPLVYIDVYRFNEGLAGLPFLAFIVSGLITIVGYVLYQRLHIDPRFDRNPDLAPEFRFELALFAGCITPISQLLFGWSARESVHWIVPTIGAALYLPAIFLAFQAIMLYLATAYPKHASSLFAGNDLVRSSMASCFPLFGSIFFKRLGLGGGSSLLAGLSILMLPFLYLLMKHGEGLRAKSKWTD